LSGASTSYQYYTYYQQYLAAYNAYYAGDLVPNAGYGPFSVGGGNTPPQSVTNLYAAANALYSSTGNSQYGAYLTAYAAYAAAYVSWAGQLTNGQQIDASTSSIIAGTSGLPLPPLPPATQAGAVVPPPVPSVYATSAVLETGPSASYRLTAGAVFGGANPLAVAGVGAGNVGIDGHVTYSSTMQNNLTTPDRSTTIEIPTVIRTGTGSIDIAAAGDVAFLDQAAPGAVYTAGAAVATPGDFTPPSIAAYLGSVDANGVPNQNGLTSAAAWANGGGSVTVSAGRDIIGVETPVDPSGSQTGIIGGPKGQFWSDWYFHSTNSNGSSVPFDPGLDGNGNPITDYWQTAAWVNYATFFQAFGALGGGNVTLTAGRDITAIGASLPQTLLVSGGLTANDPPVLHSYGGGNLLVRAVGNLNSSDFLVGSGSGLIQVGGAVQIDPLATVPTNLSGGANGNLPTGVEALPLLLAEQNGFITVNARGPVTLGNVYDPAMLPTDAVTQTNYNYIPGTVINSFGGYSNDVFGMPFTSYGPGSGVALNSAGGDVTAFTLVGAWSGPETLFLHSNANNGSMSYPDSIAAPATVVATALSGNIVIDTASLISLPTLTGGDAGTLTLVAAGSVNVTATMPDSSGNYVNPLGLPLANLTEALHANDLAPVIIAAGQDITGALQVIKPAEIAAGGNVDLTFIGQNNNPGDITSIAAGNDLTGSYILYGPGDLLLEAGRNMGPFLSSGPESVNNNSNALGVSGVATVGNGTNAGPTGGALVFSNLLPVVPYLPDQGANITALFGVGPGIDYQAAIKNDVNPANTGTGGINYLGDIASILGVAPGQAWAAFQALPAARQQLLLDRAFLDFLGQVAADYRNASSPYYGKYGRAYQAIETLFPASYGYTNNAGGNGNGAATRIATGDLNVSQSVLETQMGGDINIIGPGGNIQVGSNTRDLLTPMQEGILTLAGGGISAFTDGSILLNQSRIMTEQGGDIVLFSANGDINAGEGPKTYVSTPSISEICDFNGFCSVNPSGLVSGAGIGAVVTLPGQDPAKSNVTLVAAHGTVDAGAAGIRVAGNLNIVALHIANAFNIQVGGAAVGIPVQSGPPVAALTAASTASAATQQVGLASQSNANDQPSIILVEFLGFGGPKGGDDDGKPRPQR
jgi:hypothetical protein